jgi:hypothetical protein
MNQRYRPVRGLLARKLIALLRERNVILALGRSYLPPRPATPAEIALSVCLKLFRVL